ncbi:MAG: hypothetical protein Q9187_000547 [Circinaria calcarea]
MAQHGHSEACCKTPVAQHSYKETGTFTDIGGLKTYKTGDESATSAILIIYDIFGFAPQLLQGADILATHGKTPYQVFVPDFLNGQYADHTWFPTDTAEKGQALGAYFQGPAAPGPAAAKVPTLVKEITEKSGGKIKKWASVGMCWGGKIVSFTSGSDSPFSAVSEVHPAMIDAADAALVARPICILASGDESAEDVQKFGEALKVPSHVETFKDQVHGWMAARGDLQNPRNKAEYERGYQTLLEFL